MFRCLQMSALLRLPLMAKTLTAFVTMLDGSVKVRGFAVGLYPE